MFHERNTLALLALLCLLSPVPAQNPGDCVVKGNLAIFCHNMFVWSGLSWGNLTVPFLLKGSVVQCMQSIRRLAFVFLKRL